MSVAPEWTALFLTAAWSGVSPNLFFICWSAPFIIRKLTRSDSSICAAMCRAVFPSESVSFTSCVANSCFASSNLPSLISSCIVTFFGDEAHDAISSASVAAGIPAASKTFLTVSFILFS